MGVAVKLEVGKATANAISAEKRAMSGETALERTGERMITPLAGP